MRTISDRYWRGGTATWDATAGSKWAATVGGATGAAVPTASDDVYFDATSTGTVGFSGAMVCKSLICTGFTGTIHCSSGNSINISGGLTLSAGMSITTTSVGSFIFNATTDNGGAGWPVTSAGKTLPLIFFNGVGGRWNLQDALTSGNTVTLAAGHLDTATGGNVAITSTAGLVVSGTSVKRLTMGSSIITANGGGNFTFPDSVTNLTIDTNTATLIDNGTGTRQVNVVSRDMKGASLDMRGGAICQLFGGTWANVSRNTLSAGADGLSLTGNVVVTGTLTITGANSTTNRQLVQSDTLGTRRIIAAAATSLTDVDFMDISIVGPTGSTITSDSFNRANGALGTTDAAAGGSALAWSGAAMVVSSNKALRSTGSTSRVESSTTDHSISAKVTAFATSGTEVVGLLARYVDTQNFLYCATRSDGNVYLYTLIANTLTAVLSITTAGVVVNDTITLSVNGPAAVVSKNGTPIGAYHLGSSLSSGTVVGMFVSGSATSASLDDFAVKAVPAVTGTRLGDCLGNSGITFTTASGTARDGGGAGVKRYAVAAGNFSSTAMWSETSGGSPGASVPLPQDDVYLDANSAAGTYTIDMIRACRNLDGTGFTRTAGPNIASISLFGSITLGAGSTFVSNGGGVVTTYCRSGGTLTTNGVTFQPTFQMLNASISLQDNFTGVANKSIIVGAGSTFTTNSHTLTIGNLTSTTGSAGKTIHFGTSTFNILNATTGTEGHFYLNPNVVTATGTPTINIVNPYSGGDRVVCLIPSLQVAALNYTVADSPAALSLVSSGQINTLNIGSGRSLKLTSGTTQKIGTLNLNGVPRGGVRLPGVGGTYLSTPDSAAVSVTGDIDIRCRVALTDYTAASEGALVTKYGAAGQRSFRFFVDTAGRLNFNMSTDGTANTGWQWQAGPTFVDGTTYWVRTTRTAAGTLRFFYAADQPTMPTSWTEAGLSQTLSAGQNLFDSTSPVEIGSMTLGTAHLANGVFKRAQIRNNVLDDGSGIVFDTDFTPSRFWPFFLDAANGAAVTPSTTLANVGDGRVVIESSTAGTGATLEVGSVTGMNYVDLKDVVMNGADTYIGATSVIRSNVKGVRRGPKTGMSMMMGV